MPKPALIVVAAAFAGSAAVLGVVSIPNAVRAYENAHSVPFAAERAMTSEYARVQHVSLRRGVISIDPVTVIGDPNSSFRAVLQRKSEPLRAKSASTASPCATQWQSLRSGPTERRYRELCANELAGGVVDMPDRPKLAPAQERLVAPPHPGLDDHVTDPRVHAADRPPLRIGAPAPP